AYADPLVAPGTVDLTAHVDFEALALAAESMGARVHGPVDQAVLLRNLGIEARAATLRKSAPNKAGEIDAAHALLTSTERAGTRRLFKGHGFADRKRGQL